MQASIPAPCTIHKEKEEQWALPFSGGSKGLEMVRKLVVPNLLLAGQRLPLQSAIRALSAHQFECAALRIAETQNRKYARNVTWGRIGNSRYRVRADIRDRGNLYNPRAIVANGHTQFKFRAHCKMPVRPEECYREATTRYV